MEEDLNHFLTHWYAGYLNALSLLEGDQQDKFFAACGYACAASYTAERFQIAWKNAQGNDSTFLDELKERFPEAEYKLASEHEIEVVYNTCACDLVKCGWVKSPLHCRCSLFNLKENFQLVTGKPVNVVLQESILSGNERCRFRVSW